MDNNNKEDKYNCQIFTPEDKVRYMLNLADYIENIENVRILENSAGDGNFLVEIIDRLINDMRNNRYSNSEIKKKLETNIVAYELDEVHYEICLNRMDEIAYNNGIFNVKWNLKKDDYLLDNESFGYDLIIGNPPYIQYKKLKNVDRKIIKEKFKGCMKGKPDYYYAFIEKSLSELHDSGKLIYLIPSNIFKNRFGEEIRNIMYEDIDVIVDFKHDKIFDDGKRNTVSSIIKLVKNSNSDFIKFVDYNSNLFRNIKKSTLGNKWVFEKIDTAENFIRFGDFFNVNYSIATLYNKAFLIKKDDISEKTFEKYLDKQIMIAASPRSLISNKNQYIIFPYEVVNDKVEVFNDFEEIDELKKHLLKFKKELKDRKSDSNIKWYQYGRSQALELVFEEKIILSTVITNIVKVFRINNLTVPYSGLVITIKDNQMQISLDEAISVLQTKEFMKYVTKIGIKTSTNSFRITSSDIKDYYFDREIIYGKNKV